MYQEKDKGYLVLIGGAEDRTGEKLILRKIVNLNNAKNISVIPTATNYPQACGEDYHYAFKDLGVETINILDIRETGEADNAEHFKCIEEADVIFFTGGDQVKLVQVLNDTKLISLIMQRFYNGVTIAGTSAGAAAASNPMIFDGDTQGLLKGTVNAGPGFGFIQNITIDTHFIARGRIGRLTQFLFSNNIKRGIGLGENTAIVLNSSGIFEVIGTGIISVIDISEVSYSNYNFINNNERISINGIKAGFLQAGCVFNINKWDVECCNPVNALCAKIERTDGIYKP
ncbi:MAG: Cyanophycinase [Bacteroidetes bacterium ADurb.Bin408]|nr:MAG: Cyanophycinase [Bacteroidetes bacterium ADurb.Bin408]